MVCLRMNALDTICGLHNKKKSEINGVIDKCNKACMECLSCPHNQDFQFNLILQNLFNSWKNLDDIKGKDVNIFCGLN